MTCSQGEKKPQQVTNYEVWSILYDTFRLEAKRSYTVAVATGK